MFFREPFGPHDTLDGLRVQWKSGFGLSWALCGVEPKIRRQHFAPFANQTFQKSGAVAERLMVLSAVVADRQIVISSHRKSRFLIGNGIMPA